MASARTLARIDTLIWVLIFVGLFAFVLGLASHRYNAAAGWSLVVPGVIATVAGVVLIWVRSRLQKPPAGGAQSSDNKRGTP